MYRLHLWKLDCKLQIQYHITSTVLIIIQMVGVLVIIAVIVVVVGIPPLVRVERTVTIPIPGLVVGLPIVSMELDQGILQ